MVETAPHPHAPDHDVFGFDPEHRESLSQPPEEVTVIREQYRVSHASMPEKDLPFIVLTNMPEGANPIQRRVAKVERIYLIPSKMDDLAPGSYELYGRVDDRQLEPGDEAYDIPPFENHFDVTETKHGIAYSGDITHYTYHGIMSAETSTRLGITISPRNAEHGERVTAVPSPETFKRAAYEEFGITVRLISEPTKMEIAAKLYNDAFAAGEYPIQTNEESMYFHDISSDHSFAIMMGGAELMAQLQAAVVQQRAEGREEGYITGDIDDLTMQMGLYLEHLSDRSIGEKVMKYALSLGIEREAMEGILTLARQRMIDTLPDPDDN